MHACHAATSHRHRGRAIVIVIILTASEGTPHYAPPETEPNWLLSLPTDLVISEQEEGSERAREGGRRAEERRRRKRDILFTFIKVCSTWLPTCPPPLPPAPSKSNGGSHATHGAAREVRGPSSVPVSIWPISNMVRKQARPMSSDRMRR